jgi:transposase
MARLPRQTGGELVGPTKRGKGTKLMLLVDGNGLPLGVDIDTARPAEVGLSEPLLKEAVMDVVPGRLIYDRAADSDPIRKRLAERGVELICPHRRGRVRPPTQDGRPLRRYRRRWIIERTISWLHSFRRLVTRYEHYSFLFHSFAKLACMMIVLRRL